MDPGASREPEGTCLVPIVPQCFCNHSSGGDNFSSFSPLFEVSFSEVTSLCLNQLWRASPASA